MTTHRRTASGAILAGGRSRRFGQDKRRVEIAGRPLLLRAVDALAEVVEDLQVVVAERVDVDGTREMLSGHDGIHGNCPGDAECSVSFVGVGDPTRSRERAVSVVVDRRPGEGPVAGIEAALWAAPHDVVLIAAGDHPHLQPAVLALLIDRLARDPDKLAITLGTDHGPQPLVGAYRRTALPHVTALLDGGERRAYALLDDLDAGVIEPAIWRALDPNGASSTDVDTPGDLRSLGTFSGATGPHRPRW